MNTKALYYIDKISKCKTHEGISNVLDLVEDEHIVAKKDFNLLRSVAKAYSDIISAKKLIQSTSDYFYNNE